MRADPVRLALVGAGERGRNAYGAWCLAHSDRARIVAVAEPMQERRERLAAEHGIGVEATFSHWRELLERAPKVDAVIIATPDRAHVEPAVAVLERGYDVVLEKPIAPTLDGLRAVAEAQRRSAGTVTVAHVLRYTPFFMTLKRLVDDGRIGRLVTITHAEHIGYWHFAHSFVRGNWRREEGSSPMLLAKACHDLDLVGWLAGDRCTGVASFGGLDEFRPERAPAAALERCWDGERRCPAAPSCPFDAVRLYVERTSEVIGWPVSVLTDDPSSEARMRALASGPYGRCVYHCDNDVADHQVTALEFANGVRATLTVSGLTADNTRTITLNGTRGEIRGRLDTGEIEIRRFLPARAATARPEGRWDIDALGRAAMRDDEREVIVATPETGGDGHGGGDDGLMTDVVARIRARREGRAPDPATSLAHSVASHLIAFAAEASRHERRVIDPATFGSS